MSFPPPPPPMITGKGQDFIPILAPDDKNKCYEISQITRDEAIKQIRQTAFIELERLVPTSTDEEPFGMLIIMTPILEPILQCGPVCGLIALVEAAQLLKSQLTPDVIFAEAKRLGMTKNGEMFSIQSMQMLVTEYLKCKSAIMDTNNIDTLKQLVETCLLKGKPTLIPYDADYNHSPSLRKGHAAHWAVLHGIALPIATSQFPELTKAGCTPAEIVIIEPEKLSSYPGLKDKIIGLISTDSTYVVAHQGKSLRTAIWKYSDLIKSNQNLHEISPKLVASSEDYVLGNINIGLCSKLLKLE